MQIEENQIEINTREHFPLCSLAQALKFILILNTETIADPCLLRLVTFSDLEERQHQKFFQKT